MSKARLYTLILSAALFSAYCSSSDNSSSGGATTSSNVSPTVAYSISQAYGEGVDDNGQMRIAINGSFAPTGNTVSVTCDGNVLAAEVEGQSSSQVVITVPAASYYNDCSFEVESQGEVSPNFDSAITAMSLTGTSHEVLNANSSLVNIEIEGYIEATSLMSSVLSVSVSCNSGASYMSAPLVSQSDTSVVVSIANPGKGKTNSCIFIVQDSFKDIENNTEIVTSPALTASVAGL